jgi:hypothetical protein
MKPCKHVVAVISSTGILEGNSIGIARESQDDIRVAPTAPLYYIVYGHPLISRLINHFEEVKQRAASLPCPQLCPQRNFPPRKKRIQ